MEGAGEMTQLTHRLLLLLLQHTTDDSQGCLCWQSAILEWKDAHESL
jgi:hypothetical protein